MKGLIVLEEEWRRLEEEEEEEAVCPASQRKSFNVGALKRFPSAAGYSARFCVVDDFIYFSVSL